MVYVADFAFVKHLVLVIYVVLTKPIHILLKILMILLT